MASISLRKSFVLALTSLVTATSSVGLCGAARAQSLIIDHVTIVDTRDGHLRPDRSIEIADGRIARIEAHAAIRAGRGVSHVDGKGAYAVPGFFDMHAHPLNSGDSDNALNIMLANGITGFRQMSGSPELLARRRAGTLMPPGAPTLLALPGTILAGPVARTPQDAVEQVRLQKSQGADFIKFIDEPPAAFFAALGEAKRLGLPLAGHLPPVIDIRQASAAGMRAVEHLGPRESLLLACSTQEQGLRAQLSAMPPRRPAAAPAQVAAMAERALVNPIAFTDPAALIRYGRVLDTLQPTRCAAFADMLKANATWQVPTLIRLRTMEMGDDPLYLNDPHLRFVPARTRALWQSVADQFGHSITPAARHELDRLFKAQLALTKLFYDHQVPMLAGSDYGGGFVVPGFGLHQEFDLLAQAGLPPLAILQMTTRNGADFLGRQHDYGALDTGKIADIVLLRGNPVTSIAAMHRISAVVHDGRYLSRTELDQMLAKAESNER